MYVQTTIKYILTQGDAIITSSVTSLHEQGAYGLASNYGGLLARTFFQPIEESSRNLFAKLCTTGQERSPARTRALLRAHAVLRDIIKAYNLLALLAWAVGPLLAPPLLQVIAGNRWIEAGAGDVLAVYCYYIPLLALNGVSEAFVAAVANEEDLRKQSSFMGVYSVIFASAAFILIKVMKLGASGIVWANCLNMSLRIVFNRAYIENFFGSQGQATSYTETLPRIGSISAALGAATVLRGATPFPIFSGASPTEQLMKGGLVAVLCSTYLIYSERKFLSNAYSLITKADGEPTEQSKEGAGNAPNL
ncbi:MAG: Oligosaccharide translocation protein rft1 [Chrysothrix sp. TS-e1954]|nr:MAG: Oligosaccharide translocation protein rft1 [Chrysothrix sp. TS-e1954]